MTATRHQETAIRAAAVVLACTLLHLCPLIADDVPIRIDLRPAASSHGKVVRIGDIADVHAADREARERIAGIDVADPVPAGKVARLSRSQVSIRLMLAGYDAGEFQLAGADVVNLSYDSAGQNSKTKLNDAVVLDSVRTGLAERLRLPREDVHLRLARPIHWRADYESVDPSDIWLETRLPNDLQADVLSAKVGVHVGGRLYEIIELALEVQVVANVPTTRHAVLAGELFTSANLERRRIKTDVAMLSELAHDAVGKRAVRNLTAGETVVHKLVTSKERVSNELLVRSQETVQLVARRGSLVVKTQRAVAMDSGRMNDQVRVKNLITGRIVSGRVARRWVVEVSF